MPGERGADRILAIDIGKTNLKLSLIAADGEVLAEARQANVSVDAAPYLHFDVDGIWQWLLTRIAALPERERIGSIITTTHGACIAVIDEAGLVLPVMDYEYPGIGEIDAEYAALRDDYAVTLSPLLPGGMNVAKQLVYFERRFPAEFVRATAVLTYAQYWSWRLSGVAALEVTSLGCHSDLWDPNANDFAPLVQRRGWRPLMPPLRAASDTLGPLRPELAQRTGLSPQCRVLCGIHDNNASMVKHLYGAAEAPVVNVISSGTWVIVAGIGAPLAVLDAARDMQANVDAWGRPFACARFMGGREFARLTPGGASDCAWADVEAVIAAGTLALPTFAEMGGPYRQRAGEIRGPRPHSPHAEYALATLYTALISDDCLSRLQQRGDIIIEGPFTANRHYAALLAALRPQQAVWVSEDRSGTTGGAYLLAAQPAAYRLKRQRIAACALQGLVGYRDAWRGALARPGE